MRLATLIFCFCVSVYSHADTPPVTQINGLQGTLHVNKGGTGKVSYASGSVVFSDGTILTEDNGNFKWEATNKRMRVGNGPENPFGPPTTWHNLLFGSFSDNKDVEIATGSDVGGVSIYANGSSNGQGAWAQVGSNTAGQGMSLMHDAGKNNFFIRPDGSVIIGSGPIPPGFTRSDPPDDNSGPNGEQNAYFFVVGGGAANLLCAYDIFNELCTLKAGNDGNVYIPAGGAYYADRGGESSDNQLIPRSEIKAIGMRRRNSSTSLGSSFRVIDFSTLTFQTAANYASGLFTAPAAGYYQVNAQLKISSSGFNAGCNIGLNIRQNTNGFAERIELPSGTFWYIHLSDIVNAAQNDTISIWAESNCSSASIVSDDVGTFFSVIKVSQ